MFFFRVLPIGVSDYLELLEQNLIMSINIWAWCWIRVGLLDIFQSERYPLPERICCNLFLFLFIQTVIFFNNAFSHHLVGSYVENLNKTFEVGLLLRQMLLLTIARKNYYLAFI